MTLDNITADELLAKIERADDFILADALAPMIYAHSHLPGAINLPPAAVDALRCTKRIPSLETEIVVYCANPDCDDVRHYAGGKDEWNARGLPLERAGKPYATM